MPIEPNGTPMKMEYHCNHEDKQNLMHKCQLKWEVRII